MTCSSQLTSPLRLKFKLLDWQLNFLTHTVLPLTHSKPLSFLLQSFQAKTNKPSERNTYHELFHKKKIFVCVCVMGVFTLIFCHPQAVMNELNSYSFFLRTIVSMYMNSLGIELFMTRTVHEVLWGFKDPLLSKIHSMKPEVDEYFGLMWKVSLVEVLNLFLEASLQHFSARTLKLLRVSCQGLLTQQQHTCGKRSEIGQC